MINLPRPVILSFCQSRFPGRIQAQALVDFLALSEAEQETQIRDWAVGALDAAKVERDEMAACLEACQAKADALGAL
jgi:hypothetical protein